jgi:hypothetical protein
MLDTVQSSEHHQDDESLPKSPLLEARIAKAPQSTTPPRSAELDRTPSKRRTSISQPSPPAFNTQVPAETYRPSSSNPPSHADSTLSDPFCCPLCPSKFGGIYRQGNYGRHRRYKHGDSPRVIHCEHPGCSKQFNRTDARRKHYRSHHPELLHGSEYETLVDDAETAPRDLPVKTERIITRNTARNQALQINAAVIEDLWKDVNHLRIHDNVADANPVLHLPSLTPPHKDPLRALDPRPLEFEVDRSVKRQLESKNESQQPCNTTTSVHNQPPEKPGEYVQRNPNLPHSVSTPPREIQTEYPARGGQVYVHDSTKAKRRRSAYYGKSYNDRHAKAREHERVEAEANDKADARARREALRREAEKAEARYQAEQERKRQNRRPIVYQPAFDSGSESYSEGVEVPEARKPSRRRFADKGNREHRDHVVQKARQDETTAIEYTNPQRDTDVPLDDSIPRALERAPRRQSAVDLGEKEKHMLDENKEEELQFRAQALYNHPRSGPVQGGRPSYKSYLARSEAARSDPRYYVASHYSRWAARRGQPQSVTQPRLPPYKQLQNEAYESYSESETSSSDDEVSEAYRPPVVPVQRDKKQPVSAPGRLLTRFRGESLASDRTAMATKSSSQLSPTECTTSNTGTFTQLVKNTKDLQLGDIAVQSSSQAYDKQLLSKISGPDIPTRTTASSISSASTHDPSLKLSDQIKPLTVPTMSPSYNGWHDPGFNSADLPRAYYSSISTLDPFDETSSQYRGRYDYSIFSGPEATIDSDIELVSREYYHSCEEGHYLTRFIAVLMNPVSKDFQNAQKTNNSELKVEEEETKQMLSAGSEEVLQKSREVQMDAPVGSSDSNESLAMDVEEYSDANPKHQGSVADLKRSTSTLALENSTTDVQMDDTILSGRESDLPILEYDPVDVWLGAGSINIPESYHRSGYESTPSGSSSYAASVASDFSVTSLASSASDISKGSGYSPVQIATATKVLLSVFYEDKTLLSLYKSAMGNEDIGPERLHRNLRRLFRAYAGLLENEATERLEYLSSRLVLIKSAFLAQSIVEKLQNGRVGAQSPRSKRNEESSDEEDDSSDTHLVNEDAFEDLAIFREFLVESDAFRTFCDRLEAFILPKSTYLTHEELTSKGETLKATMMKPASTETVSGHGDVLTWQKWRRDAKLSTDGLFHGAYLETTATSLFHLMMDAIFLATDDLLIAAGRLEPPLSPNMVRLRWQCVCVFCSKACPYY